MNKKSLISKRIIERLSYTLHLQKNSIYLNSIYRNEIWLSVRLNDHRLIEFIFLAGNSHYMDEK